jgi:hypothetical protein
VLKPLSLLILSNREDLSLIETRSLMVLNMMNEVLEVVQVQSSALAAQSGKAVSKT